MVGEKSMARFQNEYEKLYRALKTSYESEKRLVKRCKELNETIVSNATRVKAALRLTQEDSSTISLLKKVRPAASVCFDLMRHIARFAVFPTR